MGRSDVVTEFVVEYSRDQKWFRVDVLHRVLEENAQLLLAGTPSDFVILFIGTQSGAWAFCDAIQKRLGKVDNVNDVS